MSRRNSGYFVSHPVCAMECTTFSPPQTTPAARTRILSIPSGIMLKTGSPAIPARGGPRGIHSTGWQDEWDLRGGQGLPNGNEASQLHSVIVLKTGEPCNP